MEFELLSGKRINSVLLYSFNDCQLYAKKSIYGEKQYYECYKNNCKSRVVLERGTFSKCRKFVDHNHGDQESTYRELKALRNIKRKCENFDTAIGEQNALSGIRKTFQNVCQR